MTPSLSGRTATILPGVRPIIRLASTPTATICPLLVLSATTLGSLRTIPRPRTYTSVFAVPRSTAMSRPRNVIALLIGNGHLPIRKRREFFKNYSAEDCSGLLRFRRPRCGWFGPVSSWPGRAEGGPHTLITWPGRGALNELREEDLDLSLGGLRGVRAVHDVLLDLKAEVASDCARSGLDRIGLPS